MRKVLFIILWMFTNVLTAAQEELDFAEVAASRQWLRLLEYRGDALPNSKSIAVNPEFFADSDGFRNPTREFQTLVRYFQDSSILHPVRGEPWACVFPARFRFMQTALKKRWTKPACKDFDPWFQNFPKDQVSLVYSSAYKGNPASIFGHTFLLFNRNEELKDGERGKLLGYAAAFLADTGDVTSPLAYTLKGVTGQFQGKFDVKTYYETVNSYNNAENRDLWEYPLKLSEEERILLIEHLWEVSQSGVFRYFFFDENCSWQMLSLIEAVQPEVDLKRFFHAVTIPSETVRVLKTKNLLEGEPKFRPSAHKNVQMRFRQLSQEEQSQALKLVNGDEEFESNLGLEVWDAAVSYGQWQSQTSNSKFTEKSYLRYRNLLVARSKLPTSKSGEVVISDDMKLNRPDLGHPIQLVEVGGTAFHKDQEFQVSPVVGLGLGLSDHLANDLGFEPNSEVSYLRGLVRYDVKSRAPILHEATVLSINALDPWTNLERRWSWGFFLGAKENIFYGLTDYTAQGSWGAGQITPVGVFYGRVLGRLTIPSTRDNQQSFQGVGGEFFLKSNLRYGKIFAQANFLKNLNLTSHTKWISELGVTSALYYGEDKELRLGLGREIKTGSELGFEQVNRMMLIGRFYF